MTYQWKKNGAAISGATSSTYTTPAETTADNNAQFTAEVSNTAGNATSNAAMLTVTSSTVAPAITTQPASQTVIAGKTASFTVAASGTAPMTYQWSKNGAAISGATSSTYTTPAETTTDNNAKFTVAVSNSAGSATSNAAVLTVTSAAVAPAISTQPASQTVIAGKTASFTVAATGTAPLTYQWSKNGAAISGATSSTYTTPAETADGQQREIHRCGEQQRGQRDEQCSDPYGERLLASSQLQRVLIELRQRDHAEQRHAICYAHERGQFHRHDFQRHRFRRRLQCQRRLLRSDADVRGKRRP